MAKSYNREICFFPPLFKQAAPKFVYKWNPPSGVCLLMILCNNCPIFQIWSDTMLLHSFKTCKWYRYIQRHILYILNILCFIVFRGSPTTKCWELTALIGKCNQKNISWHRISKYWFIFFASVTKFAIKDCIFFVFQNFQVNLTTGTARCTFWSIPQWLPPWWLLFLGLYCKEVFLNPLCSKSKLKKIN